MILISHGSEPASSSSHSTEKEKTVVEAENADERSKEEPSAQKIAALAIHGIESNVAAAKKTQFSIKGDKSGSKEEESVSSNQEKNTTSFRLKLRSSAKRQTGRCRSQKISRGAKNIQLKGKTHSKTKEGNKNATFLHFFLILQGNRQT
uniref:Uncharacterized protein n=1 Tax=Panagrolaimus davidi TaxID=227884 RepID=A0A914QKC0_9BILA